MPPSAPNRGELSCLGRSARLFPCLFPKAPGKSSSHRKSPGRCQRKTTSAKFPRFAKPGSLPREKPRAQRFPVSQNPGRCQVKVLCFSLSREKKKRPPAGGGCFFRSAVSQHTDTRPVWASRVTTAPLFKRSVACSAPVMTGLSMARPAIAAWELAPDSSVMMPEARRR